MCLPPAGAFGGRILLRPTLPAGDGLASMQPLSLPAGDGVPMMQPLFGTGLNTYRSMLPLSLSVGDGLPMKSLLSRSRLTPKLSA